jgi:hypothetical protein
MYSKKHRYPFQKRQVIYSGQGPLAVQQFVQRPRGHEKGQDLSKVPGRAGVDYPIFHSVPETSFHCGNVPAVPGIYANVETGCQVSAVLTLLINPTYFNINFNFRLFVVFHCMI